MARRRKKSLNQIAAQAGGLVGRIDARRYSRTVLGASNRGIVGDAEDERLRKLGNRVLQTYARYRNNIQSKRSYLNKSGFDGNNIQYSRSTYMGLSNG